MEGRLGLRSWSVVLPLLAALIVPTVVVGQCIDRLKGSTANLEFDRNHDLDSRGNSFSCDVGIRASEAVSALEDFRYGFLYDSRRHLERSLNFPLKIAIADDQSEKLFLVNTVSEWLKFKASHFDKHERALIACSNLANVTIHKKYSGFAIGTGRIWFFRFPNHGLRVGHINVASMSAELFRTSCVVEPSQK